MTPRSSSSAVQLLCILASALPLVRSSADVHKRHDFSFRGPVPEDLHIPHWDLSGSAQRIPTAKDFLRLLSPFPLSYGAMFTENPIPFDQWSVEIAFRVHGGYSSVHHGHHPADHRNGSDDDEHLGKGGRGLAFWYSKTSNPTALTSPANPHRSSELRPTFAVAPFPDPLDEHVSFFGGPVSFDGLAVVFDNQPSTPLARRSDRRHWSSEDGGVGAEEWAVVSGVLDNHNGKSKWLEDRTLEDLHEDEEAAYLNHTIGDCQVALRNAPGMVWAKITHIQGHLRVYLDLSPHTNLAGENRHYGRECFSASNVQLPKGYYMGLTGLASPNDDADNVDIYAIEVKEIKGHVKTEEELVEHYKEEHVAADDVKLEGTSRKSDADAMATEGLNAQRTWVDEVKRMSAKLDALSGSHADVLHSLARNTESTHTTDSSSASASSSSIASVHHKLDSVLEKLSHSTGHSGLDSEVLKRIHDLEQQTTKHERFLSEQIEELRHLILYPPSPEYKEDEHFRPLESLHDAPSPTSHAHLLHGAPKRSMMNFLLWVLGFVVVFWAGFKIGQRGSYSRRGRYDGDEGSFPSGTNPISMTMDAFGFRQRSKKMI